MKAFFSDLLGEEELLLVSEFGAAFSTDYGWAAEVLENNRPTFADIEAAVDLSIVRPTYKAASAQVHAGADGLKSTGLLNNRRGVLVAGASNAGLADPGPHTALSLALQAGTSATLLPTVERTNGERTRRDVWPMR
jgi:hypothetical protein